MRLIPAPPQLAPDVLGVLVVRAAQPQALVLPAHALALLTVVLRGTLAAGAATLGAGALAGSGSRSLAQHFRASADLVCASLLCRASVLPRLTGEPASTFSDAAVPAEVFGARVCELWEIDPATVTDERIAALLFAAVATPLRRRLPRPGALRFQEALPAWGARLAASPRLRPPEGWSERHWLRACQAELGVTPKLLQRLARLHASVRGQSDQAASAWARHALDAGFADQAHLARDYRLLAGMRPSQSLACDGGASALRWSAGVLAPRFFAA